MEHPKLDDLYTVKDSLNSRIYKLDYKNKKAILKKYKSDDPFRIKREINALKNFKKYNFEFVPELLYVNKNDKYIIISEIKGSIPNANYRFLVKLSKYINNIQKYIDKKKIEIASEAGFSLEEHFKITKNKLIEVLNKIKELPIDNDLDKTIIILIEIIEWIALYKKEIFDRYNKSEELNFDEKIFSQSDIGSHNCLIQGEKLYTFDYEYAGLDDPAKTFCDLVIHPDSKINDNDFEKLLITLQNIPIFKKCSKRAMILLPIYRYKWFAIILKSYIKSFDKEDSKKFIDKSLNYLMSTNSRINRLDHIKKILI